MSRRKIAHAQKQPRIFPRYGIPVNDLHTLTKGFGPELFSKPGDVHFNDDGYDRIAQQVAAAIEAAINKTAE